MTRWFTSDTHFGHANIIKFSNMPFKDIQEHDEALIQKWNERVKPEDHVYHLGDVTLQRGGKHVEPFIKLCRSLNGHKRLFLGNHDHFESAVYLKAGFEVLRGTWRDEENIIYSHFPLHPSTLSGVIANVHGHIHGNPSPKPAMFVDKAQRVIVVPYINICVEMTDYAPIDFNELKARIRDAAKEGVASQAPQESKDPGSQARML